MLDAIEGLSGCACDVGQAKPDQHGAGNMVALNARLAALVFLNASQLLEFAVKLLNFPAHATHLLRGIQRILSQIVGYNPIRAVGRHRNPEQFYFVCLRKAFDLDGFAVHLLVYVRRQPVDSPVRWPRRPNRQVGDCS